MGVIAIAGDLGAILAAAGAKASSPQVTSIVELPRTRRYRLQGAARAILPENKRLQECGRRVVPGSQPELWQHNVTKKAHYRNLVQCGQVWLCPVCAAKITQRRREELQPAMDRFQGGTVLGTVTVQHHLGASLVQVKRIVDFAWDRTIGGRAYRRMCMKYGIVGQVTSYEVTYTKDNGWHPHKHFALFLWRALSPGQLANLEADLSNLWTYQVKSAGGWTLAPYGCQIERSSASVAEYLTKWGPDYDGNELAHSLADRTLAGTWKLSDELTRANVKKAHLGGRNPFQLLESYQAGDLQAGALFREYAAAMKGCHQLQWSRGLRALLGLDLEQTDQEIIEQVEQDCSLLYRFNKEQWTAVLSNECLSIILDAAETLEQVDLEALIMSLAC